MRLMVFILYNVEIISFLIEDFSKAGIKNATIINSTGMSMLLSRINDSLFGSSFKSLFEIDREDNRIVLAVIKDEQLDTAREVIYNVVGDLSLPNRGVLFTVPIDMFDGVFI